MICRLCIEEKTDAVRIFHDEGINLNISTILQKYFWFEINENDAVSTAICNSCWCKVYDFHTFFLFVENAQSKLSKLVKTEHCEQLEQPFVNEISQEYYTKNEHSTEITINSINNDDLSNIEVDRLQYNIASDSSDDDIPLILLVENKSIKKMKTGNKGKVDTIKHEPFCEDNNDSVTKESIKTLEMPRRNLSFELTDTNKLEPFCEDKNDSVGKDSIKITAKPRSNLSFEIADTIKPEPICNDNSDSFVKESIKTTTRHRKTLSFQLTQSVNDVSLPESVQLKRNLGKPTKNEHNNKPKKGTKDPKFDCHLKTDEIDEKIAKFMKLICDKCGLEQINFAELRLHLKNSHKTKGYALCCGKKFYKRVLLADHIAKHIDPDCYKCQDCDKIFADKQCMRNHFLIKHQPEESKLYQCEHCSKKFAKPYLLEQHRIVHEDHKHICIICQKGFRTVNMLSMHMKLAHENCGTMCDICAKVISGRANFKRHQLEHEGVVLPKVQCDKCGSWLKNKFSLQKHKIRHNEEGTLHICEICNKIAPNRSALLSHKHYVHAVEKSYNCFVCKKSFKKSLNLKEHMATHTGEVLYKCPHCTKTFNSNANMHSHRKKVHPKEFEEYRKNRLITESKSIPIVPMEITARQAACSKNLHSTTTINRISI